MTDPQTLRALAERVEKLQAPCRETDALIACSIRGYTMHEDGLRAGGGAFAFWLGKPHESSCLNCSDWPAYTASLDAAAGLVPQGWWVGGVHQDPLCRTWHVYLEAMGDMRADGEAATEPNARTAAALRARAAQMEAVDE